MKPIDIILIVAIVALVIGASAYLIVKKKKGQTACGCGCSGCQNADVCAVIKKNIQKTKENENKHKGDTHV